MFNKYKYKYKDKYNYISEIDDNIDSIYDYINNI